MTVASCSRSLALLFSVLVLLVGVEDGTAQTPPRKERPGKATPAPPTVSQSPAPAGGADPAAVLDLPPPGVWSGDLDGMVSRRIIRAYVIHSKTFFFLDGGQPRGISYEALKAFEEFLNRKLKTGPLAVKVLFIPVSRDELLRGVVEGRADLAVANLTITPERRELVDFSTPALRGVKELVVTGPTAPKLARLEDLAGREVYVRASSSYFASLERLDAELRKAGKPGIRLRRADENLEDEDILEMVSAGLVGITVVDSHKAEFWAQVFDKVRVHADLAVRTEGEIGWAFRKGSPKLRAAVDEFVTTHRAGTTFGNVLLRRYLQSTKWVKNATAAADVKRFEAMIGLFEKYAGQYGFDWLMIAAQAYQESQLDQSRRSRAGAVGVMQIKPSTAAGAPIGIRDIDRLENNIHAGVKYLKHIADRYYADEALDPVNRTLFVFASYNAGPARIAGLRKQAQARGLDPNRWHRNVELVVAREIGRETVQYVSNIYKYYLAYGMVVERMKAREAATAAERAKPAR